MSLTTKPTAKITNFSSLPHFIYYGEIAGSVAYPSAAKTALKRHINKLSARLRDGPGPCGAKIPADKWPPCLQTQLTIAAGKNSCPDRYFRTYRPVFLPILRSKQADFARMLTRRHLLSVLLFNRLHLIFMEGKSFIFWQFKESTVLLTGIFRPSSQNRRRDSISAVCSQSTVCPARTSGEKRGRAWCLPVSEKPFQIFPIS